MASVDDEVMSVNCQLITQYTARRGSAESSVDDFDTCRGDVFIRAVTILRYIESQPSTGRFVNCYKQQQQFDTLLQLFSQPLIDVITILTM